MKAGKISSQLKTFIKYIFPPRLVHLMSYLSFRTRKIWVFGNYDSFSDNPKYLFLYLSLKYHANGNKVIWISTDKRIVTRLRKKGLKAFTKWSFGGLCYSLVAGYYFYSSYVQEINYLTSGGAVLVNLNHHVPIKKIEYDIEKGAKAERFRLRHRILRPYLFKKPDYLLSTSELGTDIISRAHRIGKDKVLEYGFPRTDIFFWPGEEQIKFIKAWEPSTTNKILERIRNYKKVLIYMPTWRDSGRDFLVESGIDFDRLTSVLEKRELLLLLKLHVNTELNPLDTAKTQNVLALDNKLDVYPLLPFTDCLITDYSSTFIDYLLLDKEIIFFPFDIEKYTTIDRELYFNYEQVTPGLKVYTYDKLERAICNFDTLDYSEFRKQIRTLFWNKYEGKSCEKTAQFFLRHSGQA